MYNACKFCNKEFGLNEERYKAQEQWRRHGKWNTVGHCCVRCLEHDGEKIRDLRTRTWRNGK